MLKYIKDFKPDFEKRPLSYSSLKQFMKSPQHFVNYITERKEPSQAMLFGSIFDCLLLTPEDFEKNYVILPTDVNFDKRTKEGKANYEAFILGAGGRTIGKSEDYEMALFFIDKIKYHEKAKVLIQRFEKTQLSIRFEDKVTGIPIVAKLDAKGDTFICDIKTANDASPDGFQRSAYELGYHIQAGIYSDAMARQGFYGDFYHIVFETVAPYNIAVYKASKDFIRIGKALYQDLINKVKYCNENNFWGQGYEFHTALGYHHLELPGYAKYKLDKYK